MMDLINVVGGFLLAWVVICYSWGTLKLRGLRERLRGSSVNAIIIRRNPEASMFHSSVDGQFPQNYTITFQYEYGDTVYSETQVVSKNYYIQHLDSSEVYATCNPSHPQKVILAGNYLYRKQETAKPITLFLLGTLGLLLLVVEIYLVVVFSK